jgi:flagellar hook-associated protein 1 FlgK
MADILKIGLSALLAQQRALTTTANNIANASTPGYSRQRVELLTRTTERAGPYSLGTGVDIGATRRLSDDILADQLRTAAGGFHRADAFVTLASSLDDLLAGTETGLTATLQSFANALQNVSNDPSSTASRQALLSEARNLVARFDAMDQRLTELADEVRTRMGAAASQINSLGADLAEINRQLIAAGTATGRPAPSDLLDERDRLLEKLGSLVQVTATTQRDGTTSVFIGTGQVLVLGTDSAELEVTPGNADPLQPQIVLGGIGPDVNVTQFVTGGELGGVLDFSREMLAPTRSELGRIAVGLVATVNAAHRSGMDAEGELGGDFFTIGAPQAFAAGGNTGTGSVAVTVANAASLEPSNYRLTYAGGTYTLQRVDTGAVVPMTGAGTPASPFLADGLSIVVSGTPAASDQFFLKPLEHVPGTLGLVVTRPGDIAAAAPTRTSAALTNTGNASISAGSIVDPTHASLLSTATIAFVNATTYTINGAGSFAYTAGADIDVNGTRVQISGTPAAGDEFVIQANAGGTGDNRNVQTLIDRLRGTVFDGEISLQDATAALITSVGSRTAEATNQRDVQQLVLDQNRDRLESVRGVNLDEEAADMLKFEQLYNAAARMMSVSDNLFQTLLSTLLR